MLIPVCVTKEGQGQSILYCFVYLDVCLIYSPMMDLLKEEDIEKEIRNTFKGLADKEGKNKILFQNWPKIQRTRYELEPEKRSSGLEGATTTKNIAVGLGAP